MLPELADTMGSAAPPPKKVRGPSLHERSMLAGGSRVRGWSGIVVSIAAHVAMFGGALVYARLSPPRVVAEKPIVAKLVRLGKPRDEKLLPRLPTAPPPPPPAQTAAVPAPVTPPPPAAPTPAKTINTPAKHEEKAAEPAADRMNEALERQKRLAEALGKLGKPEEAVGRADGDRQGDADDAAEGDRYLALLLKALKDNYTVPTTISEKERLFLKCTLVLKIAGNGKIIDSSIGDPSGNDEFDRAVLASVKRTGSVPPPPAGLLKSWGDEGVEIVFKP